MIAENVSDSTGLSLGVHTTINPRDAESYAVSGGQKDIFAIFDRRSTAVKAAFRRARRAECTYTPDVCARPLRRCMRGARVEVCGGHQPRVRRSEPWVPKV